MKKPILGTRLAACAAFARQGAYIADVGTDHAYLCVSLTLDGKICGAVASDINEGPLKRAKNNIEKYNLSKEISLLLTDGLNGIEAYSPDDIFILGMGGELISNIISKAEWIKNKKYRLILQPMTAANTLREYLLSNSFEIKDEVFAKEEKIYQVFSAEYTGITDKYSLTELLFGRINLEKKHPLLIEFARKQQEIFCIRKDGKKTAGLDTSYEDYFLIEIEKILQGELR